jgi:hypothetical protein
MGMGDQHRRPNIVMILTDDHASHSIGAYGDGGNHDPQHFEYWDVLIEQGEYINPRFLSRDGLRTVEGDATDVITDLALAWLERLEGDDPWRVLIYHKAPHRPWQPDATHGLTSWFCADRLAACRACA